MLKPLQLTRDVLLIEKGVVDLRSDSLAAQEFINGFQAGHLAYMAYWRNTVLIDTLVVIALMKRQPGLQSSLVFTCGYLVGWLTTLVRKSPGVVITHDAFTLGYQDGICAYFLRGMVPLTLPEMTNLLTSPHGDNSMYHVGYIYGFLKGFTLALRTSKPHLPGEEEIR